MTKIQRSPTLTIQLRWKFLFSPVNIAPGVYSEVPPYSLEAVSFSAAFPNSVNIQAFLNDPKRRSRHSFTQKRKEARSM